MPTACTRSCTIFTKTPGSPFCRKGRRLAVQQYPQLQQFKRIAGSDRVGAAGGNSEIADYCTAYVSPT